MSIESANKKYLKGLMNQVVEATEEYTRQTVRQTLRWLTTMTVQDSGNAAYNWHVNINGTNETAVYMRNKGHGSIGDRGDSRRPAESISSSDFIGSLSGQASDTPWDAIDRAEASIKLIQMDNSSYEIGPITIYNPIDELSNTVGDALDLTHYAVNALGLISIAEASRFGAQRGHEAAMKKGVVKRVT